jgi:hypothetical protein
MLQVLGLSLICSDGSPCYQALDIVGQFPESFQDITRKGQFSCLAMLGSAKSEGHCGVTTSVPIDVFLLSS